MGLFSPPVAYLKPLATKNILDPDLVACESGRRPESCSWLSKVHTHFEYRQENMENSGVIFPCFTL
jgi:hypothetical protein